MANNASQRILIVGGGLGGLALAQGLKRAQPPIPFRIFERDSTAAFRAQGYRVRILAEPLEKLLPPPLLSALEATSGEIIIGGHALDALTGQPAAKKLFGGGGGGGGGGPPPGALPGREGKAFNADRTVLRNILLKGLEDDISFGKHFEKYQVADDGTVEVQFADGSTEKGALLVGADGVRSAIRRQLIPDFKVLDTQGRAVFGKTDLTEEIASQIPEQMGQGINLIGEQGRPMKLFCETMKFTHPDAKTSGVDVPADYVYWVLCFHSDEVDKLADEKYASLRDLISLSSVQATELGSKLTSGWHESLRGFLTTPNKDSTAVLAFFICEKEGFKNAWKKLRAAGSSAPSHITLLGDAVHPMPPVGGVGANAAFQEAAELCKQLSESDRSSWPHGLASAVVRYEELMVERAAGSIEQSAMGAGRFFGMKPLGELEAVQL